MVFSRIFKGGHFLPDDYKRFYADKAIKKAKIPPKVILPLIQHTGLSANQTVNPGDKVLRGQLIATAQGNISSALHSPVSGTVVDIGFQPHPVIGRATAIVIESDMKDDSVVFTPRPGIDDLSADELLNIIRGSGVVGLGGAAFPTHVKLSVPPDKKIDSLIINGAECEPYITVDHRTMLERPKDIISGIKIIEKIIKPKNIFIAIEDNKKDCVNALRPYIAGTGYQIKVLKTKYPQGAEKQLIKTILNREFPYGGLPSDVGVLVVNVSTAAALYEAVHLDKPLYERPVTISGPCVNEPMNLLARIGTPLKYLVDECGGFKKEPKYIIFGGPMTGLSQYSIETPIIKGTNCVLFFQESDIAPALDNACIRCARCVRVCPAKIQPALISVAVERLRFDIAKTYNCLDCIECGLCSYVCPAKRNIVSQIKYAKHKARQL